MICNCYQIEDSKCRGTKEIDPCSCGGDMSKCDFYAYIRERAKKETAMSENYIVINGKRAELTEKQLRQLGIKVGAKNPMSRVAKRERYYCMSGTLIADYSIEENDPYDEKYFALGNYFNDKDFAVQMALHTQLYFLLTRFTYENGWDDALRDNVNVTKWYIVYSDDNKCFMLGFGFKTRGFDVLFKTETIADRALHEVVEPFMKEHPEFRW